MALRSVPQRILNRSCRPETTVPLSPTRAAVPRVPTRARGPPGVWDGRHDVFPALHRGDRPWQGVAVDALLAVLVPFPYREWAELLADTLLRLLEILLSWPVALIAALLLFRTPIRGVLEGIEVGKVGAFELLVNRARGRVEQAQQPEADPGPLGGPTDETEPNEPETPSGREQAAEAPGEQAPKEAAPADGAESVGDDADADADAEQPAHAGRQSELELEPLPKEREQRTRRLTRNHLRLSAQEAYWRNLKANGMSEHQVALAFIDQRIDMWRQHLHSWDLEMRRGHPASVARRAWTTFETWVEEDWRQTQAGALGLTRRSTYHPSWLASREDMELAVMSMDPRIDHESAMDFIMVLDDLYSNHLKVLRAGMRDLRNRQAHDIKARERNLNTQGENS